MAQLVPGFLPNVGCLHCPRHPAGYEGYDRFGSPDAEKAAHLISYRILPGPGGNVEVEATETSHFGVRHRMTTGGRFATDR